MSLPSVTFRSELPPVVRKELDQLDSELSGYLLEEHDDDGHHTAITADSITVEGPVTILGGPLTINGEPITGTGTTVLPHHATHEPGGTDVLVNAAWVDQPNTFTQENAFNADVTVAGNADIAGIVTAGNLVTSGMGTVTTTHVVASGNLAAQNITANGALTVNTPFNVNGLGPHNVAGSLGVANGIYAGASIGTAGYCESVGGYYERSRTVPMGVWTAVPFNAGNFAGTGGMTWTVAAGNVATNHYTLIGKTAIWSVSINSSTLSGAAASSIVLTLPGGVSGPLPVQVIGQMNMGPWIPALVHYNGGTTLTIYRVDTGAFVLGPLFVMFQIVLPLF